MWPITTLLHQPSGVSQRFLGSHVEAHPRHVPHDQRLGFGARHGGRVVDHVVECDLVGRFVTEDHVGHRIADQDHVDAGRVGHLCARIVVGRDHRQPIAALARFDDRDRDLLAVSSFVRVGHECSVSPHLVRFAADGWGMAPGEPGKQMLVVFRSMRCRRTLAAASRSAMSLERGDCTSTNVGTGGDIPRRIPALTNLGRSTPGAAVAPRQWWSSSARGRGTPPWSRAA